jgi:hypothetical protein
VTASFLQDSTYAQSLIILKGRCLTNSKFSFALLMEPTGGGIFKLSSTTFARGRRPNVARMSRNTWNKIDGGLSQISRAK